MAGTVSPTDVGLSVVAGNGGCDGIFTLIAEAEGLQILRSARISVSGDAVGLTTRISPAEVFPGACWNVLGVQGRRCFNHSDVTCFSGAR